MTIAVTTPTGTVGRHVVRALLRAGARPRVLLRDPSRLDPQVRDLLDPVVVDQFDADSVVAATRGVDTLHWVVPSVAGEDPLADYARAADAVARAVQENGIARVVLQSSVGAERRHGAGEIDGLAANELALEATGASVVHLRSGFFFSNLLLDLDALRGGELRVALPVDQPMGWVAPRDIAEVSAGWLLNRDWSGRHVQAVHGPEDLSWQQAVRIVSEATGRPLTVTRVADEEVRDGLLAAGASAAFADAVLGMSTGLRDGFVPEQPRSVVTTTPTTLAAWSYEVLRPAIGG
jgi:uncharacterized protein YbjT (DUF2867 family)